MTSLQESRDSSGNGRRWWDRLGPGVPAAITRSFYFPLVIVALILLFLHRMVFTNLILARGDVFLYFYPYWQKASEALRAGRVPLWNPHLFMGAPFLANSQAGFFYPLNWPLWLALSPPLAVKATIVLHLIAAGAGTYLLARHRLSLSPWASTLAAALFALGGYLTAQVEHVNQLQGLAWLPWLLVACQAGATAHFSRRMPYRVLALSILLALQLTAGHVQTVFISGVALLMWCAVAALVRIDDEGRGRSGERKAVFARQVAALGVPIVAGFLIALLLAGVQLLPALELTRLSSRQGGLSLQEATSFSLHPLLLSPSLLPAYGRAIFSEYAAFLPLSALLLAAVGAWRWKKDRRLAGALALAAAGLFLALGRFNPLYLLLARLPGFNLFRAPARWLVLYALGMALLAGTGWDFVTSSRRRLPHGAKELGSIRRGLLVGVAACTLLIAWHFLSVPLARFVPVGAEVALALPSWPMLLGWLAELALAYLLIGGRPARGAKRWRKPWLRPSLLLIVPLAALFVASRSMTYHRNLTAPAAYTGVRPAIARLQAMQRCDLLPQQCASPPGRLLSLSDIFFDPGDLGEITAIYGDRLSAEGLFDYVVAVKQKAIVAPNLPLAYGLFSVDGFDGGILPLRDFTALVKLILPQGVTTTDGRLREHLQGVPEARWLDLFNARFLITDKVGDRWHQGVFFDLQHPVTLAPGDSVPVGALPDYQATELRIMSEGEPGSVTVQAGDERWEVVPQPVDDGVWTVAFPRPEIVQSIILDAGSGRWRVLGLSLVDDRDDTFHALVPGFYRQIYSGDVKIYENLDVLPRAFLVHQWRWQPDAGSSLAEMSGAQFEPGSEVLIEGEGAPADYPAQPESGVEITRYTAGELVVSTSSTVEGFLVLTDAYYPGWRATLDGEETPIYRADGFFRGVFVPAGNHEIRFEYRPSSYAIGRWISLGALLIWTALALAAVAMSRGKGKIQ